MLGSTHDAEDALQEALLRAWKALPHFEGRSSLRSWLYTIATNASLDAMKRRPNRIVPIDQVHPADPHDGPAVRYERRESLERALGAARDLPRNQRAVLVMREMLGFSARETADALGTSVAAVNSALQRARATLAAAADAPPRPLDEAQRRLLDDAVDAFNRRDVTTLVALLRRDAGVPALAPVPSTGAVAGRRPAAERLTGHGPSLAALGRTCAAA
jgi:RNA polymerase sigma-70 factor (ECF subfamily)